MIAGNGYDTTRSIRMNHNWDRLPIIALTTHALEGDEEKCRAAGCNHYLTNLFTLHQLSAAIAYCLETASKPEVLTRTLLILKFSRVLKEEFLVSLKVMVDDLEMANLNHDLMLCVPPPMT
jgi:DNA-binding response OmpR family regulator